MGYIIITLKLIDLLHGVNQRKRHIQRKEQKLARDIFQSSTQAFTLPKTGCYEREKVEIKKVGGKRAVKIEEAVPRRKRAAVKEETISNENIKVEIKTEVKQEDLLIKSEDE